MFDDELFRKGDIFNLPDEIALKYIEEKYVEPFSYSISDDEIRILHGKFCMAQDFYKKVDVLLEVWEKTAPTVLLNDGPELHFEVFPKTPDEWYYYNTHLTDVYKNVVIDCNSELLLNEFLKRDLSDLKKSIDDELNRIDDVVSQDAPKGLKYWYDRIKSGGLILDDDSLMSILNKPVRHGLEIFLYGRAVVEYEHFLNNYRTTNQHIPTESLSLKNTEMKNPFYCTLKNIFKNNSEYQKVMKLLVKEDYCHEETYYWKDEKKGSKSLIVSLIKKLHLLKYYERKPTTKEVQLIAKNTFGINLGVDTIKRTSSDHYYFDFLPNALEIVEE